SWDDNSSSRIDFGIDYYYLLGSDFQPGKKLSATDRVKKLYPKIKEYDRKYREVEVPRVSREVEDFLRKKLGRQPLQNEISHLANNMSANWDNDYYDDGVNEAFLKYQIASDMKEIFTKQDEKD